MFLINQEVFDEIITGTVSTWYTPTSQNSVIGLGDSLLVLAHPTSVVGTTTISAYLDTSSDNQHWILGTSTLLSGTLVEGTPIAAYLPAGTAHSFGRIRINLGNNANGQCRLKISITGRSS